jgi:hypothetical protein
MPKRDRTPLHDIHGTPSARFTTTPWDVAGIATLEASGSDVRSALEAGLRAVLKISTDDERDLAPSDRSVPLQGEGEDLAELFLDLIEDILDQLAFSPFAYHDVVIDGVLHRDGGGYVAWGFAAESTAPPPRTELPYVQNMPTVESRLDGIVFRAALARAEE